MHEGDVKYDVIDFHNHSHPVREGRRAICLSRADKQLTSTGEVKCGPLFSFKAPAQHVVEVCICISDCGEPKDGTSPTRPTTAEHGSAMAECGSLAEFAVLRPLRRC
ncbi:hypothetical protein J6590_059507 [Homalodisca vitripennis]|nr:hypothetical protein J6590_059507 [Homalodisca vitripennis]